MAFGNEEHAAIIAAATLLAPSARVELDNPHRKEQLAMHVAELAVEIVKQIKQQRGSAGTS
jgi:hypothetical protein